MSVVPIVTIPSEILNKPTEKVGAAEVAGTEIKQLIQNLLDTVLAAKDPIGAGLAAPQIGVSKRVCVVRRFYQNPENPDEDLTKEYVLINPKIISSSDETVLGIEGCLSVPDTYGNVERAKKIKIKALNEKGEPIRMSESGFMARVIQHEIDHLDGILFTTKITGKTYTEAELDEINKEKEAELVEG